MSRNAWCSMLLGFVVALTGCGEKESATRKKKRRRTARNSARKWTPLLGKRSRQRLALEASVTLPEVRAGLVLEPIADSLVINVEYSEADASGSGYVIEGKPRSLDEVKAIIRKAAEASTGNPGAEGSFPNQDVLIRADAEVTYEPVREVMRACYASRVWKISFAAQGTGKARWTEEREFLEGRVPAHLPKVGDPTKEDMVAGLPVEIATDLAGDPDSPRFWIDEWSVANMEVLATKLSKLGKLIPEVPVIVKAAPGVRFDWVVRVAHTCRSAEFASVLFAALGAEPEIDLDALKERSEEVVPVKEDPPPAPPAPEEEEPPAEGGVPPEAEEAPPEPAP